jgi:predicted outer membrane lipoprotein
MYGADGPDTFWLNFTNIALGLVTLACVFAIVSGIVHELAGHRRRRGAREHDAKTDDHAFVSAELGLTMADGGRRIDSTSPVPSKGR